MSQIKKSQKTPRAKTRRTRRPAAEAVKDQMAQVKAHFKQAVAADMQRQCGQNEASATSGYFPFPLSLQHLLRAAAPATNLEVRSTVIQSKMEAIAALGRMGEQLAKALASTNVVVSVTGSTVNSINVKPD